MEETKRCPYCGEEILAVAKKCKHCGEWLELKETSKVKKPCPICGEFVDDGLDICPHCKEPINDGKDNDITPDYSRQEVVPDKEVSIKTDEKNPYKNNIQLAFGAIILGGIFSFANDCAQEYPSGIGGLVGLIVNFGRVVPSWLGAMLDGIGSMFLLWNVADCIRNQKKAEGRDDDATSLLIKSLSILYFADSIVGCFAGEGTLSVITLVLGIIGLILTAINGFILKSEEDSMLANIGKAFIASTILAVAIFRALIRSGYDPTIYLCFAFINTIIWIYAMYMAHKYLLKNK